ncbi:ankyrin-3 [Caerostris darwini]|uniref:Ankyrin-3 n=1 Tax=Caerostris darwini TaxID=1538125 RepID=A0AAV4WQK0_9ARAC|nr:ankyrin-3 [Caerostris darwini]
MVETLLNAEADAFIKENNKKSATDRQSVNHRLDVVKILIQEKECDVSFKINGNTLLHLLAAVGSLEMTKYFVENGADIHAKDSTAAQTGKSNVCELLIERSADVNAVSIYGSTPLHLAAGKGFKDIVGMLLHNGAFYNALDGSKLTPLQRCKENSISTLLRIAGGII